MKKDYRVFAIITAIICAFILVPSTFLVHAEALTWSYKADLPSQVSYMGYATGPDGKTYVVGGYDGTNTLNSLYVYDPSNNSWSVKASMPTHRYYPGVTFSSDGNLYVIGGAGDNGAVDVVESYNPNTDTWSTKPSLPGARGAPAAATGSNGKIYVFGGFPNPGPGIYTYSDTVLEFNPVNNTWTQKNSMSAKRGYLSAAANSDGKIYVVGGIGDQGNPVNCGGRCSLLEAYDPLTDVWITRSNLPVPAAGVGLTTINGKLYALGGNTDGSASNAVYKYNPAVDNWEILQNMLAKRSYFAVTNHNGQLYAAGGTAYDGSLNTHLSSVEATIGDVYPPAVTGIPTSQPNTSGWYNHDVTIDWQSIDPDPSSGTPTQPPQTIAMLEGQHTYNSDQSCDPAGNCSTGNITLKIDKTSPITGTPTASPALLIISRTTTISASVSDSISGVSNAEYFIGTDPGQGNGLPMVVNNGTATAVAQVNGGPLTSHIISVRSRDVAGNWSAVTAVTVIILL